CPAASRRAAADPAAPSARPRAPRDRTPPRAHGTRPNAAPSSTRAEASDHPPPRAPSLAARPQCTACPKGSARSPHVLPLSSGRKEDGKTRTLSGIALELDPAAVRQSDVADERESDAAAFRRATQAIVGPLERAEDAPLIAAGDPRTSVF